MGLKSHILGFPRIGEKRELKKSIENFWQEKISFEDLEKQAFEIRDKNFKMQADSGLSYVTTGDFSFYDHILDTTSMLGLVPARYEWEGRDIFPETYFHMARGDRKKNISPMEMKKWFNTNYHYIVPEFEKGMKPVKTDGVVIRDTKRAKELGYNPKPVLTGPFTWLILGKAEKGFNRFDLLDDITEIYCEVIKELSQYTDLIQIDEPVLATDIDFDIKDDFIKVYNKIKLSAGKVKIMIASYFDEYRENISLVYSSGVDGLHVDIVNAGEEALSIAESMPESMFLSAGIVDGRNIWINNLDKSMKTLEKINSILDGRLMVGSSCSLIHSPVNILTETKGDEKIMTWFSFAKQKLDEISFLKNSLEGNTDKNFLEKNINALKSRNESSRVKVDHVRERIASLSNDMFKRNSPFEKRAELQRKNLGLPLFPVTTIGSFPQTPEIRKTRAQFKKGLIEENDYKTFMKNQIKEVIDFQEETGIDVFVHGEPERNDMVEYFGENLEGFLITENGWVQSYGTRCVKPPVIYGDVWRRKPITTDWINYGNCVSDKPVKGMLTGPVTILCWSFKRDDISYSESCTQIALAIRDEVLDLEKSGTKIIQIDEAALREGLPLRKSDYEEYLEWAVKSFCLCSSGVDDKTQIHTHMCYSEFNSIMPWIAKMDADVISIESSRSQMTLLDAFQTFKYPNEIGPGVYDIHSPRVPSEEEIINLFEKALLVISPEKLWVNPDCGLKTRAWPETKESLKNMVNAALVLRKKYENKI